MQRASHPALHYALQLVSQVWSTSGLRTDNGSAAGLAALAEGFLRCESDHLTEFAGLSVPTNADELMEELEGLQIMLPCADGWFDEMVWEDNPLLYQLVFLGSLFDLLSLPLFAWRYKRRQRKLILAVAAQKAETDGLGMPHGLTKFTQSPTGSMGGVCKVSPTTRTLRSSEKHGLHLDFTALTPSPPPSPPIGSPSPISRRRPSVTSRLPRPASHTVRRRQSKTVEAAQVIQDDAAVMAAIEERARAAAQTAAVAPKQHRGGLTLMQAALRRQMEVDQAAAAAAAGGSIEHRLAETMEAAQAQEHLKKASRFGRMGEAVKLVQQSSCFQMTSALKRGPYGPPGPCWPKPRSLRPHFESAF